MKLWFAAGLAGLAGLFAIAARAGEQADEKPAPSRKIVLIGGKLDAGHPRGTHEYEQTVRLLAHYLDHGPNVSGVRTEVHFGGWPADPATLDDADSIVIVGNGSDRNEQDHPLLVGDRLQTLEKQMQRGCGLVLVHWATFMPRKYEDKTLEWVGGYFDYESGDAPNKWLSRILTATTLASPASPEHPICRGLEPFELQEEYYYRIRFREGDPRWQPILKTPIPGEKEDQTVAWAVERENGGRGFGFTGGHFFANWGLEPFRRMVLNALLWTAHADVPAEGVQSPAADRPIQALVVTGHQYPGHLWRETTPAIQEALAADDRIEASVVVDPEELAKETLREYDVVIMNYCNWERAGLSREAQRNFAEYLHEGGSLVIVHFANGAFHFSLPKAGESDWPEWRTKICRRVWDHTPGKSAHDAYGKFTVQIAAPDHPIVKGMQPFETTDELYCNQQGDEPIEVVATARSTLTGRDEPMAFAYRYGKGRVFQTVLGHDAASLRVPGTAELVRRGTVWAAFRGQKFVPEAPAKAPAAKPQAAAPRPNPKPLVAGRFGDALDAQGGGAEAPFRKEYAQPPLTAECWAKLRRKAGFNILIANQSKDSANHWELYTYAGSGALSAYMPGFSPAETVSPVAIVDDAWHHVAMTFDGQTVALFVDGRRVHRAQVERQIEGEVDSPLWIGGYPPQAIGCAGQIDEVRLSNVVREITAPPTAPLEADEHTLGLWRFDGAPDNRFDDSAGKNPATLAAVAPVDAQPVADASADQSTRPGHFDDWSEEKGKDNRWQQTVLGPFASASFRGSKQTVTRGIAMRLGDGGEAAACFDTEMLRMAAGWTGGFVEFDPGRFGLIGMPSFGGEEFFQTQTVAGWAKDGSFADPRPRKPWGVLPREWGHYQGLHLHGNRVLLRYNAAGIDVREAPWAESGEGQTAITRTIEVDPSEGQMSLLVADVGGRPSEPFSKDGATFLSVSKTVARTGQPLREETTCVALRAGDAPVELAVDPSAAGRIVVRLAPHATPAQFKLYVWRGSAEHVEKFVQLVLNGPADDDLAALQAPGPPRWPEPIVTRGQVSDEAGPYVVDTLTVPFDNPYKTPMFASGHDFFSNGDAAVCIAHGEVWRVSGIDERLERLEWKRFATGLFQPLGIKIVDEAVYVVGRDQITRLHDENGDGEADRYENFNNDADVSHNGHEYATCLETDREGNFYYFRGDSGGITAHDGCLLRVSPDGDRLDVFATGFRNANGLAIGPDGTITAAPQEGNWTPASGVLSVKQGGFYGMYDVHHRAEPPADYEPPICWIPRQYDNSSGGQVWTTSDRFGPLGNRLLHFSYGRCSAMLVLRDQVDGREQGAVVKLPLKFDAGIMRGRMRPQDGQLYVTGLRGWVSSAVHDGCLQRVRYVGGPAHLPESVRYFENGIAATFFEPLDKASAEDPDGYRLEHWNYRRGAHYGSADYKPSDPKQEGREPLEISAARLQPDGRTVFLAIPGLQPVNQFTLELDIESADGAPLDLAIHGTIHKLAPAEYETPPPPTELRPGQLPAEIAARLMPGWVWKNGTGVHAARLAAAWLPGSEGGSARNAEQAPPLRGQGFLQAPRRGAYRMQWHGNGRATILLRAATPSPSGPRRRDGWEVAIDLEPGKAAQVPLHRGYNRIEVRYAPAGATRFRLLWAEPGGPLEPIPPTAMSYDAAQDISQEARLWHRGRTLYLERQCANCHGPATSAVEGPNLADVGSRLQPNWLFAWLLDPTALGSHRGMPRLLHDNSPASRRLAADLVAYLATLKKQPGSPAKNVAPGTGEPTGERLYERLGCVACHRLTPPGEADEFGRLSLHFVNAKFDARELATYLSAPHARHAASRMPDFRLGSAEATALAEYLSQAATGALPAPPELQMAASQRGEAAFSPLGCIRCHRTGNTALTPNLPAPRVDRKQGGAAGCVAVTGKARAAGTPDFALDDPDRQALAAFLPSLRQAPAKALLESQAERAERLVQDLRCLSCHSRDGSTPPREIVIADEGLTGLPPETLPPLTWAGEKLQAAWVEKLLKGELPYRARPWLAARMPAFGHAAHDLAVGLAAAHGYGADEPASEVDATMADAGRRLTLKDGGLDCRQCHGLQTLTPKLPNESQGISFLHVRDRLRRDFYDRWLFDPLRVEPRSKMPKFVVDGQRTAVRDIFEGDAQRQIDALWQYLQVAPDQDAEIAPQKPAR